MTSRGGVIGLWISGVALVVLVLIVSNYPRVTIPVDGANAAGILTLVTGGAVAIERIMESFWTIVGTRLGNWWPLKPIGERLDAFITQLNDPLRRFYQEAEGELERANQLVDGAQQEIAEGKAYLAELQGYVDELLKLNPGNPSFQRIAGEASRAVVGLKKLYPTLESSGSAANRALASVNEFVQTFADNPARRLMSIYAGAVLGLIFAWVLGLDAIQAVLGPKDFFTFAPNLGVAATGLVIGLGAAPTHEVIKTLQEIKKQRKLETLETEGQDRVVTP